MIRKRNVKSLAQKKDIPITLPPLQRRKTQMDETQNQNLCTMRPSTFLIRKKTTSFMETTSTRKPEEYLDLQQNLKSNISAVKPLSKDFKTERKDYKIRLSIPQPFKKQDLNLPPHLSINKIELDEPDQIENSFSKKSLNENESQNCMFSSKSLAKKSKKRKIQQCKMRKIVWGHKNTVFDLTISAIKQNQFPNEDAPLESLQDLYSQII